MEPFGIRSGSTPRRGAATGRVGTTCPGPVRPPLLSHAQRSMRSAFSLHRALRRPAACPLRPRPRDPAQGGAGRRPGAWTRARRCAMLVGSGVVWGRGTAMRDAVEGDQSGPAARAPLNAMQRGFWAARRLHSGRALDNRFMKLEWRLALDLPNLERALEALVARTDALRLVFGEGEDGEPWQHAVPHLAPDLETRNFEAAADPEAEADAWLDSVCAEPFDLSRRPFRTALARLGPERWIWALCLHHIVTDRTSNEIMVRRLSDLYGEALTGRIAPAPPAPGFLDRPPADPPTRPSSAAPPPPVRLYGVEGTARSTRMLPHRVLLGRERLAKAKAALGLKEGLPGARGLPRLFDLLATASAIHAVRVSGARVVALGAPTHGRYAPESAEVAGPFIRVLPLTVEIPEGARVREALDAVRAARRRVFSAARAGRPPAPARFAATINFIATPMPDFHGAPSLERPAAIAPEAAG